MTLRPFTLVAFAIALVPFVALPACGSSGSTDVTASGDDAGASPSSTTTSPTPTSTDTAPPPTPDAGSTGGCVDGTACALDDGTAGLCKAGTCSACVDTTDDAACKKAYASTSGFSSICSKGACVQGDCHANADCTGGKICGLATANTCGACTSDSACASSYGAGYVCNTQTGGCVSSATACTAVNTACSNNAADICCAGAAGNACTTGTCCSDAQCADPTKPACVNHVCTGCPAVTNGQYYVDPSVADDSSATGGPSCPFKSLTRALAVVGNAQPNAVTINIKAAATLAATETLPFVVPTNVSVKGDDAQPAMVGVPSGKTGFVLGGASSGLASLVIDGGGVGTTGIVVTTGTSKDTTIVKNLTVKNMLGHGIVVNDAPQKTTGGAATFGPGLVVKGSGTAAAPATGLVVRDHGVAYVTGTDAAPSHFDQNTEHGIRVIGNGQLVVNGAIGANPPATGTVTVNGNAAAGLWIAQTPGTPPVSTITGLTAWNATQGNGIRLFAGSAVVLRSSSALGNAGSGVLVSSGQDGATVIDDISKIDLGKAASGVDAGKNVFQATASPNVGAGVCLNITANKGQLLMAEGNTFAKNGASVDCSGATATSLPKATVCSNGTSIAVVGPAVNTNTAIVLGCTIQ